MTYSRVFSRGLIAAALAGAAALPTLAGAQAQPGYDGLWVACGYSGHGNVLGLACGDLVASAILARPAPELHLFDPEPRL